MTWDPRGSPDPTADPADSALLEHIRDALVVLERLGLQEAHVAGTPRPRSRCSLSIGSVTERSASTSFDRAFLFGSVPRDSLGKAMYAMWGEIVADEHRAAFARVRCPALFTVHRDHLIVACRNSQSAADMAFGSTFRCFDRGGHYGWFGESTPNTQPALLMRSVAPSPVEARG